MGKPKEIQYLEQDGDSVIVHPDDSLMSTGYVHRYIREDVVADMVADGHISYEFHREMRDA